MSETDQELQEIQELIAEIRALIAKIETSTADCRAMLRQAIEAAQRMEARR